MNFIFCLAIAAGVLWIHYFAPVAYTHLIMEDSWGEYGTFVCYIFAFALVFWAVKLNKRLRKPGYTLFALFLFFIGMEEISWGQRLIGITTPQFFVQLSSQSELNFHNSLKFITVSLFCGAIIIWSLVLPQGVKYSAAVRRLMDLFGIPLVKSHHAVYFLLAVSFLLLFPIVKRDEVGEFLLSFAFLIVALDILCSTLDIDRLVFKKVPLRTVAAGGLFILGVSMTAGLVFSRPDIAGFSWRFHAMASRSYPAHGLHAQAEKIFLHLLNEPQLRTLGTRFEYGVFLQGIKSDKATAVLEESLSEQYEAMDSSSESADLNRRAGLILKMLNRHAEAKIEFEKALVKDKVRLDRATLDWERSLFLASMGKTYFEMGENMAALEHFRQAFEMTTVRRDRMNLQEWLGVIEQKIASK